MKKYCQTRVQNGTLNKGLSTFEHNHGPDVKERTETGPFTEGRNISKLDLTCKKALHYLTINVLLYGFDNHY